MLRRTLLAFFLLTAGISVKADHITGGEMYYTYAGSSAGMHQYELTLKLYMRCNSGRTFPNPAIISIFDRTTNTRYLDISVALSEQTLIELPNSDPCINNPPRVCFEVAYYRTMISVPASQEGFLLASQVNYRINGMANLNGGQVGATYTCEIPGTAHAANGPENSSAVFTGSDLVIICANNIFSYSFAAEDADGDLLSYSFCSAYNSSNGGINGSPTEEPPFAAVPYANPEFADSYPLGSDVSVNSVNGMISGIAPGVGQYVVTVCVQEIRNGIVIATQRKDIQVNVADCDLAAASLAADYMLCRSSRTLSISNLSASPLIKSQNWEIKNPDGSVLFSSSDQLLNYTFTANGTYTVKLVVNAGEPCSDSTERPVYVYPGFVPDFDFNGICFTKPTIFQDRTTTVTGVVNTWRWDFGEMSTLSDVSNLRNPVYTYPTMGARNVRLIVTNTDGCRDTVTKMIQIIDKPPIGLAFKDTLICLNDQLQLRATGSGSFTWSPVVNMINPNSPNPIVSPTVTTKYYVHLDDQGCLNDDSVTVRVVDHVSLSLMPDSSICSGDTIQLRINTDGLQFAWTPAAQILDPTAKNPFVITPASTNYDVTATIGGCSTTGTIHVEAIPYPFVFAGNDTTICFNTTAKLQALTNGDDWHWTPAASLSDAAALGPLAAPPGSTAYVFSALDFNSGCPKPAYDTVLVTVLPEVIAFAGNDTAVVINQTLQFAGTGGVQYEWWPVTGLSSAEIADPVGIYTEPSEGIEYRLVVANSAGCKDSAYITVKVFATSPIVFVPSAFTPNNDGKNDVLKPIPAGIARIEYFMIYNRWGQLVFQTNSSNHGWDGRINGRIQGTNTFVWMVKAVDYTGKVYFQKGTVTLIQ